MPTFGNKCKCPLCLLSELYTLLLEDILVLLQKQDERLILKCHSKNLAGTADTKHIFSPIIKLSTVLVRSVATGQLTFSLIKDTSEKHHPDVRKSVAPCILINLIPNLLSPSLWPDNKSFFVLSMSDNGAQIYELMAPTVSDQKT